MFQLRSALSGSEVRLSGLFLWETIVSNSRIWEQIWYLSSKQMLRRICCELRWEMFQGVVCPGPWVERLFCPGASPCQRAAAAPRLLQRAQAMNARGCQATNALSGHRARPRD